MMKQQLHGYLLEFRQLDHLLEAAAIIRRQGYREIEAFTPFPVIGLDEILPSKPNPIPLLMLLGGLVGALGAYGLQYYTAVVDYPIMVGGKPPDSWPAFIPVTFELAVLGAALVGFLATIWVNGLPQLNHPVFAARDFDLASRDRFFLLIEARDERFDVNRTVEDAGQTPLFHLHPVPLEDD